MPNQLLGWAKASAALQPAVPMPPAPGAPEVSQGQTSVARAWGSFEG